MANVSGRVLMEKVGVAQAPSKDYGQLLITDSQITFRLWRITPRTADAIKYRPKQWNNSYADFLADDSCQREIFRFFGPHVVEEAKNFAIGGNGLLRLPENVMLKISASLSLLDVKRLGRVCRSLNEFCNSDNLWHSLFQRHYTTYPVIPEALVKLAAKQGWKRLFFTNKLQLQVQLRKERRGMDSGRSSNSTSYFSASDDGSATKLSFYEYSPKSGQDLDGISLEGRQTAVTPLLSDKDSLPDQDLFIKVNPKLPGYTDVLPGAGRWSTVLTSTDNEFTQNEAQETRPASTPAAPKLRDSWTT